MSTWPSNDNSSAPGSHTPQRLGDMGWAEWNLRTGESIWSDQVYAIFGRDPGEGPIAPARSGRPRRARSTWRAWTSCCGPSCTGPSPARSSSASAAGARCAICARRSTPSRPARAPAVHGVHPGHHRPAPGRADHVGVPEPAAGGPGAGGRGAAHERGPARGDHARAGCRHRPAARPHRRPATSRRAPRPVSAATGTTPSPLPDGRVVLAIGDVSGHGLPAIARMAQLRHALVGLAMTGESARPAAGLAQRPGAAPAGGDHGDRGGRPSRPCHRRVHLGAGGASWRRSWSVTAWPSSSIRPTGCCSAPPSTSRTTWRGGTAGRRPAAAVHRRAGRAAHPRHRRGPRADAGGGGVAPGGSGRRAGPPHRAIGGPNPEDDTCVLASGCSADRGSRGCRIDHPAQVVAAEAINVPVDRCD